MAPRIVHRPHQSTRSQALADTETFWRIWAGQFRRDTKWRDAVMRSLLTLKALIHEPTGAMVAAATTSLPEALGGTLNWDYRYCWLRDASFTIAALLNAGYRDEAMRWRDWMLRAIGCATDKMRIMYRVDGGRRIYEHEVPWLAGYDGAIPVRVGNDAAAQHQTDVVGELLDALDLMTRGGVEPTSESLGVERELVTHLERVWRDKGHGLWEDRDEPERYTYGRVMSWVGVDRFLRGAAARTCDPAMIDRAARAATADPCRHSGAGMELGARPFRASLRRRSARCQPAAAATGRIPAGGRSAHERDHRCDRAPTGRGRAYLAQCTR